MIVGRCADYILKDKVDLLTVFIHFSMESRAVMIVNVYGETDEAPGKRLKYKDKRRVTFYQLYIDLKWNDVRNYHISLDIGTIGIDKCANPICELYKG